LNAYVETLPQFAIRAVLHKAWVAILQYYEGKWRDKSTPSQTTELSPQGTGESHDNAGSSAPQTPTSLDEHRPLELTANSDSQPVSHQGDRCVRAASQSSELFFPTSTSIATDIAPFSIDEIIASTEPRFFAPTDGNSDGDRAHVTADPAATRFASFSIDEIIASAEPRVFGPTDGDGPDGDRAHVTADPAATRFASFSIDEIIASAEPRVFGPTDGGGPVGDKTKYRRDSRFPPSIDAINTSVALGPTHTDGYIEYPRVTSGSNTSSNLTFATVSQSVEAA
jgi:hypothetical protein